MGLQEPPPTDTSFVLIDRLPFVDSAKEYLVLLTSWIDLIQILIYFSMKNVNVKSNFKDFDDTVLLCK